MARKNKRRASAARGGESYKVKEQADGTARGIVAAIRGVGKLVAGLPMQS